MFRRNAIAIAVGSMALFSGCATTNGTTGASIGIEPVFAVRGGVDAEAQYRIGRYYQGQLRHEAAEKAFLRALTLDPYHAEAHNALGTVYFELGRIQKAEEQFKRAIALAPARAHLHNNLGYLYQEIGRADDAISAYSEALRLDPKSQRILNNLAALTCEDRAECLAVGAGALANAPVAPLHPTRQADAPAEQAATRAEALTPSEPAAAGVPAAPQAATTVSYATASAVVPTVQLASVAPNVWELRPAISEAPQRKGAVPIPVAVLATAQATTSAVTPVRIPAGRIEIANGNGVRGMAARMGGYLRDNGYASPRLTNHQTFSQRRTEIQYVAGSADLARQVERSFGQPARLVQVASLERQAPVRVVLGKDFDESTVIARGRMAAGDVVALVPQKTH